MVLPSFSAAFVVVCILLLAWWVVPGLEEEVIALVAPFVCSLAPSVASGNEGPDEELILRLVLEGFTVTHAVECVGKTGNEMMHSVF